MLSLFAGRRRKRRARVALVEADAKDLVARFGEQAYYVARNRDRDERKGDVLDADRLPRHWAAVAVWIAGATGRQVGLDAATRHLR